MASITLRNLKGSPLTIQEMDNNFSNINTDLGLKLNSASYTASDVLTKLKTVDGAASGLDADLVKGLNQATAATVNTLVVRDASGNFAANVITSNLVGNVTGTVTGNATNVTGTVAIVNGGTGGTSTSAALNNLLPSGEVSGYVLKTSGPGSYYWSLEQGATAPSGTRIDSSRIFYTATASQTLFTGVGTYTPGASQLRVYIDGVRQFDSEYTETSSTSFTLNTGVSAGTEVMAEVDGYIDYAITASEIDFTPTGNISATNVQDALAELDTEHGTMSTQDANNVNITGGSITGLTTLSTSGGTISATTLTATTTLGIGAGWTAVQSGTDLIFKYSGVNKMKIDSSGNLTVVGNVTAYGTV